MIIRNATVLSMDPEVGDLDHADVLVEGDRIAAVGPDLDPAAPGEVIDGAGTIVVPGFVDTHRHMWEAIARGCAPHDTLTDYFTHILDRIGPALTPREVGLGEALSARAALDAGVTTVQDISNIHGSPARTDAVVEALQDSGLRTVLAYGLPRPGASTGGSALPDDVRRVHRELAGGGLVTLALDAEPGGDHDEKHNAALADELGVCIARHSFASIPPSRLRDLGVLRPGTTFIHGNGLDADELALIAGSDGSLSVAPAIEMAMGHGFPVTTEALAVEGLTVNLSVDVEVTCPSDMFTQMRAFYLAARTQTTSSGLTVHDVLRLATLEGARGLGLADRIGSITPGKQADLVILRADRPDVAPVTDAASAVVLQMDRSHVDTVLVGGSVRKQDGRPTRDDGTLLEQAGEAARRLASLGVL